MGSGSSHNNADNQNGIRPTRTIDPLRQTHPISRHQNIESPGNRETPPSRRDHRNSEELKWPLPPAGLTERFEIQWPASSEIQLDQFVTMRSTNTGSVSTPTTTHRNRSSKGVIKTTKESIIKESNLNQMTSNKWQMHNSSIHDSAHVQSTLKTQSQTYINISNAQEINTLITSLSNIQTNVDDNLKRRLDEVSKETKRVIEVIVSDTQGLERELLKFGEKRQKIYEESYSEWLQKYIAVLDQWYSKQLADWQKDLAKYQKQIFDQSQRKIAQVNEKAYEIKQQILIEEQTRAASNTQVLFTEINSLSTQEGLQSLGSEKTTEMNLLIKANVGTRLSDENHSQTVGQNSN